MILAFDLDDTLYEEATFATGGMRAVAAHLARTRRVSERAARARLLERLARGRERVFDDVLPELGLSATRSLVRECLRVYRSHPPKLRLHSDARRALQRFRGQPLYVVTDGHRHVQAAKIAALGLEQRVTRCFVTHRFGRHRAKPSPWCFERICALEQAPISSLVYVGDNPRKDFVGLKPLGVATIRVRRGMFADVTLDARHEADVEVESLDEVDDALLERLMSRRKP